VSHDTTASSPGGRRVPANDLEQLVIGRLRRFLADEAALHAALQPIVPGAARRRGLMDRAARLARDWPGLSASEVRQMLLGLLSRVSLHADRIDLHVRSDRLPLLLTDQPEAAPSEVTPGNAEAPSSCPCRHRCGVLGRRSRWCSERTRLPRRSRILP
jgi:hypothetical protein